MNKLHYETGNGTGPSIFQNVLHHHSSNEFSTFIRMTDERTFSLFSPHFSFDKFFMNFFSLQILQADRMSSRICHACISFLNSWQSFKNRCHNAQKKQQQFLDVLMAKERMKQKPDFVHQNQLIDQQQQQQPQSNDSRQKILKSALLNSTSNSNGNNLSAIDFVRSSCTFR